LQFPVAIVHEYDSDDDVLRPLAASAPARDRLGDIPVLSRGKGVPWQVYESGEPVIWDAEEYEAFADFDERMQIDGLAILPLGDHGIFSVLADDGGTSPTDISYAKMLAQNTRAVLDRAERERQLESREQELEAREQQLDLTRQVLSLVLRHNVRNNLNIVKGYAEIFMDELDEEQTEMAEKVVSTADDLLSISDNGPGIPEAELAVRERGEETALQHGSGIGLWVVEWVISRSAGTLAFETDADGTDVTVWLPTVPE